MPDHLKKCKKCKAYSISPNKCPKCGGDLENVYPPKFSLQDKFQKYRMDYFRQKMAQKYPDLVKKVTP